jgi:hypothetical protein
MAHAKETFTLVTYSHCYYDVVDLFRLQTIFATAKPGDPLRKHLNPRLCLMFPFFACFTRAACGPAMIEHALLQSGFKANAKVGDGFDAEHGA